MKMTGDGGPPESSSYDSRECGKRKWGIAIERQSGERLPVRFGGGCVTTSQNAVAPPTGMQWAGISLRFTIGKATDILC